jgi:glycosyltransferase involved in cell wall biosynthesis
VSTARPDEDGVHRISVVIPVYGGEKTLTGVVNELLDSTTVRVTDGGNAYRVHEILLVYDNGPDHSDETIRTLAGAHNVVTPVWLSRNYGQHAATLAGMASSGGDWIVTMDEDGQHDPSFIPALLDTAMSHKATVVYAEPVNPPPHGPARNIASRGAKWVFGSFLAGGAVSSFQSYRLVLGELGRSVAAYSGAGVYLDVALGWVAGAVAHCPVRLREEGTRPSGYSFRRLLSHFWRLVLTSGTRGLRVVSGAGVVLGLIGVLLAVFVVVARLTGTVDVEGWASVIVVVLVAVGAILFSLGMIAEYLGVAVNMALGKPPYLIVGDPAAGPLGRTPMS